MRLLPLVAVLVGAVGLVTGVSLFDMRLGLIAGSVLILVFGLIVDPDDGGDTE